MALPPDGVHCGLTAQQADGLQAQFAERAQVKKIGVTFERTKDEDGSVCLHWAWQPSLAADGANGQALTDAAGGTAPPAVAAAEDDVWDTAIPDAAITVVQRVEGFSAKPYDDNGAKPGGTWTIGYGTIVDASGQPVTAFTPAITEADAVKLLTRDMRGAAAAVHKRVTVPLTTCQAAALISWTYNLGEGALGKSTMLKKINGNEMADVPDEMRKWVYQGSDKLLGLVRRRWAEAAIFQGMDGMKACDRAWSEITTVDDWPAF